MEPSNNLELKGSLQSDPLAELLREISRHRFNGALRLSNEAQKIVVYFDAGAVIFAVSNARQHRLYEMILQTGKISRAQLVAIANFTNDLALRNNLLENNLFDKVEIERLFKQQIGDVLQTATAWQTGEWIFSPLVRLKGDVSFQIDLNSLLMNYGRNLSVEEASRKFRNVGESFKAANSTLAGVDLTPHESFVYSRFESSPLTLEEIRMLSGLPEAATFQIVYNLWLGGFLNWQNQPTVFFGKIRRIAFEREADGKKDESKPLVEPAIQKISPNVAPEAPKNVAADQKPPEPAAVQENRISLDEYLERTQTAENFYELFALPPDSDTSDIKKSYFALAKRFHPDLYRREAAAPLHLRIQNAFSEIAHAYEVLKDKNSREVYDFKMRKQLAEIRERQETGATVEEMDSRTQADQAGENFDQGFNLLMDGETESALPFLARAVFFAKDSARYHAYYGKALAGNPKNSHQAESELQIAVKLDDQNADYRIMLAEFFIQLKLFKRAEGELKRLLAIFPSNREAQTLLDTIKKK